jgi:D-alanyl-D-alanine carboxypeptidase (penicillin-binding protein 5/6)
MSKKDRRSFRRARPSLAISIVLLVLCGMLLSDAVAPAGSPAAAPADAKESTPTAAQALAPQAPALLDGRFASAILVDAHTGDILAAKEPHARRQPASMLKMMTELLVLERIAAGDLSLEDEVKVSAKASKMGGSQVYLKQGEVFTVEELLQALAIHSANDAAMALAEHVAGSEAAFLDLMNMRARELGMADSEFHSVHGLPPGRGELPDMTSAHDMAVLARALIAHPEALHWGSTAKASFRDGTFDLYNPNKLIGRYRGLDGLKTGYHARAGYCVTATAVQKGVRLISVVMGAPTDEARATESTRLLSYGFNLYERVQLVEDGRVVLDQKVSVGGGKKSEATIAYVGPLEVTVLKTRRPAIVLEPRLPDKVEAPVSQDQVVGEGVALLGDRELGRAPIVTVEAVARGSWWDRLFH